MSGFIANIGSFLSSIAGNATMLGICAVMIAGVLGRKAIGIVKKLAH